MTDEEKLIAAFSEATNLHANDGVAKGLHPMHVANIMMLGALEIAVQIEGVDAARRGLLLAASQIGMGNAQ